MSKQDDDPHLRHLFTHFVARRGIHPSNCTPPLSPGQPVYPLPLPPSPKLPALAPPSSSARRRVSSFTADSASSTAASNSTSYSARLPERRRTRSMTPDSNTGAGAPAYPQAYPHSPPPQSQPQTQRTPCATLTHVNLSHAPPRARPIPASPRPYGAKAFPCPECSSIFDQRGQLSRHVKRVHEKLRPFACEHCGRLFGARSDRTRHISIVHKDRRDDGGRDR